MTEDYRITNIADLDPVRADAFQRKHDESLAFVEVTKFGLSESVLTLPLQAQVEPEPPNPDVLICSQEVYIGVEVTRVTWQRMSQVAKQAKPGELVELTQNLLADKKARRGKKAGKAQRSGDYRAIKNAAQPLDGDGFCQGEAESKMLEALIKSIEGKKGKICGYKKNADRIWLFLIDDSLPFSWEEVISFGNNKQMLNSTCLNSGFERVLLFEFGSGVSQIYGDDTTKSPRHGAS